MNSFYQINLGLIIAIVRGVASRDTIQQAYNADKVIISLQYNQYSLNS